MTTQKSISNIIADIKSNVAELEIALSNTRSDASKKIRTTANNNGFSGPTGGIKMLLNDGFFKEPRTLSLVVSELSKEGYNYRKEVVSNSLIRLVKQRLLTRIPTNADNSGREKWNYAERK